MTELFPTRAHLSTASGVFEVQEVGYWTQLNVMQIKVRSIIEQQQARSNNGTDATNSKLRETK